MHQNHTVLYNAWVVYRQRPFNFAFRKLHLPPQTKFQEYYIFTGISLFIGMGGGSHVTITPPIPLDLGPGYLPPATDIWWSCLETCLHLFT